MVQYITLSTTIEAIGGSNAATSITTKEDIYILGMSASIRFANGVLHSEIARESVTCELKFGNDNSSYQSSPSPDIFDLVESYNSSGIHQFVKTSVSIAAQLKHFAGTIISSPPIIVSLTMSVIPANEYKDYILGK